MLQDIRAWTCVHVPSRTEGATPFFHSRLIAQLCVIILVLLEYGLRLAKACLKGFIRGVLILILLEYGLRPLRVGRKALKDRVLILILLEYGLRLNRFYVKLI